MTATIQPLKYDLVFDVGMSEGNDTAFYLGKGFHVVGLEADSTMMTQIRQRFAHEIATGKLQALNKAASGRSGDTLTFWHNRMAQGHSSLDGQRGIGPKEQVQVETIAWPELESNFGVPYYLKVDIEGSEVPFLQSMRQAPRLPPFVSTECHTFEPVEVLFELGYKEFKLVNQTILPVLPAADPQVEGGKHVPLTADHISGCFGRDLPAFGWESFPGIARQYDMIRQLLAAGSIFQPWVWFDCHARRAR